MDTEVDLTTVDRAVLIAIIAELQVMIVRLERRVAELEGQVSRVNYICRLAAIRFAESPLGLKPSCWAALVR